MGLDMYLYSKPKGTGPDRYKTDEEVDAMPEEEKDFAKNPTWYLVDDQKEAGYWRKDNAIHAWFVEHVQGGEDECNPFVCHPELLADLMERCKQVLADHSLAPQLLPTRSGFFFGPTDYDEYYFNGIEATVKILEDLPREHVGRDIYYQSSW